MNKGLKRGFSAAMAAAMAMSMMVMPVGAEEGDKEMKVQCSAPVSYTLSIPYSISLSTSQSVQTTNVGVSDVNMTPTLTLVVKIKSGLTDDGIVELTRKNDDQTTGVSTVTGKNGVAVKNGFYVAKFREMSTTPTDENAGELNSSAMKDGNGSDIVKAGTYEGTIVFESEVRA